MTAEQHAQRVRQIAFQLQKADYGMGMPRDYQLVLELRVMLDEAIKNYANALIAQGMAQQRAEAMDSDYDEGDR